jgi:type IV secretory pathway TraG/TraD family ATPase VirD4
MHSLTHGTNGLRLELIIALVPLLIALFRGDADLIQYLLSPIVAIATMLSTELLLWLFGVHGVLIGIVLCASLGYAFGHLMVRRRAPEGPQHRRGAVVSPNNADPGPAEHITLAGIPVSPQDETKHFKMIGTTGTGKSTAIKEILTHCRRRGDRAIIADPDGGYLRGYYDPSRDVILNPLDLRSRKWDMFGEITHPHDVEHLVRALIADNGASDRTWPEYARTLVSAMIKQAINADTRDEKVFLSLLHTASNEELKLMLAGTMAQPFLAHGNEKMFGSLRSVATSALRVLEYTSEQTAEPFSVRRWVREGNSKCAGGDGGILFLPYKAGEIAALATIISAWMRLGIFEAMTREEGDQRLWFIVDELDALGEIDGLKDALARLRKFGGRCILGFQSISQVSSTYGKGVADTIVENCGNTLILRCSASERGGTSEFASKLIGQRDVIHTTTSQTRRPTEWMSSTTKSQQLRTEPAVMASEIERLPDLAGYLKLASNPDWLYVTLKRE